MVGPRAGEHRPRVLTLGHRSVLLAARDDTRTAHEVRAGYAAAVGQLNLEERPVVDVPSAAGRAEDLAEQVAQAVKSGVRAVLVHNDQDAIQLPPLPPLHGLGVPDDVAPISYDDVYASLSDPPLTAVAPPWAQRP